MNNFFLLLLIFFLSCTSSPEVELKFQINSEPTSLEKQIIGEDKEIEKDGWLISSIKTSSIGNENWKIESEAYNQIGFEDKSYSEVLKVIFYTSPEIQKYKSLGLIGEGLDGLIHFIGLNQYKIDLNQDRIKKIINLNNDARVRVYETRVFLAVKKFKNESELIQHKQKILLENYFLAEKGEYIEKTKNNWIKK